jgi:uncharacterized membrane protein YkoI
MGRTKPPIEGGSKMHRRTIAAGALLLAASGIAGGAVAAASAGDDEAGATGPDADRATAAALAATGGGRANAVERDGEKGATWEVEVTKADGTTVDVRLDGGYKVVVMDPDSEASDQAGGP